MAQHCRFRETRRNLCEVSISAKGGRFMLKAGCARENSRTRTAAASASARKSSRSVSSFWDRGLTRPPAAKPKNLRRANKFTFSPRESTNLELQQEALANHLFAFAPQVVRMRQVKSIRAHARARGRVVIHLA